VKGTVVGLLSPVVQPQSTAAGASERETGLGEARPRRRATQRVSIPMGESLMVGVAGEVGRDGRGSRKSWGRKTDAEGWEQNEAGAVVVGGGKQELV
jgi:hypothetical protein